jgi:lipopolysaccharide transport system ATP-binding protein
MAKPAIHACALSKQYTVAALHQRHDTLRDEIMARVSSLLRFNGAAREASQQPFWALRDVSFDVECGEVVGVIGRNGAGKSTLLKLLSRITEPTSGRAEIYGRVGSLLEVGIGFDRELTGRENVYLNGAILGMKKREIDRKFDEIVAFAEVDRFIDSPVKRYSSGMYLRLAFAVAAHLEPDILLLDEVLAVGDARFQARCLGKMEEVAAQGRTIIFVSHNMAAITRFCTRCIWLDEGTIRELGDSLSVVGKYLAQGSDGSGEVVFPTETAPGSEYVRLLAVRTKNGRGDNASLVTSNEPITLEIEYETLRETIGLRIGATLIASEGSEVLSTKDLDFLPEDLHRGAGRYVSRCVLPGDFLNYGRYFVSVGADFPMIQSHFNVDRVLSIRIENAGSVGNQVADGRRGLVRMKFPWSVQPLHRPNEER